MIAKPATIKSRGGKFGGRAAKAVGRRARLRHANRILPITRSGVRRGFISCLIQRTAGYGPVCPVVWEGRSRETAPYPD